MGRKGWKNTNRENGGPVIEPVFQERVRLSALRNSEITDRALVRTSILSEKCYNGIRFEFFILILFSVEIPFGESGLSNFPIPRYTAMLDF